MKTLVHRLCSLTLLLLLSFLAFAAPAVAQNEIADPLVRVPAFLEKSRAKKKNTSSAAATTAASGYNFQVLYSFGATATDGTAPEGGLIRDSAGNLYGTTVGGGAGSGGGTIFKLDTTGEESVLYSFCSATNCTDGMNPRGLVQDAAGNLYGTTVSGGVGDGVVFKLAPPAQSDENWTQTVLYSFGANNADGSMPLAGLIQDATGSLYGTTSAGGTTAGGTVFMLAPPSQSGGSWTETVLHSFDSTTTDGLVPYAGLIQDAAGNLYGTTAGGGSNGSGDGTVFMLAPPSLSGGSWTEALLYNFCSATNCTDGYFPEAGLIQDAAGNLYGTTLYGGANTGAYGYGHGGGTVFKLAPPAQSGGIWTETVLYSFGASSTDGYSPQVGLIQDAAGNLYGTTVFGGANTAADNGFGGGTVFKLAPPEQSGGIWTETVLYNFCSAAGCTDGLSPLDNLIQDVAGNLYGTAFGAGAYGGGTVFKSILIQTPTLTVTPSSSSITSSQALTVGVRVGGVNGDPAPTGTVTLTSGSYASAATTLTGGGATINIPSGSLSVGTDTLTVSYSGDNTYQSATGTATVTVVSPGFTIGGAAVTVVPGATTGNSSTITVTPSGGFTGSVAMTAAITSEPSGAQNLPTLSFGATSPVAITGASAGMATLIVTTTPTTGATLVSPARPRGRGTNPGGATLAFALLIGMGICVPVRGRCRWTRLAVLILMAALTGAFVTCSSNGGGGTNTGNPGTTPGVYTVTVTGTSGNTTAMSTVILTVQ
jgi:uncharacterized repeat protein (TIGR03803 family)